LALGGLVMFWLGLAACQRQPESVYLWPFAWEDAAPVLSSDAAGIDAADAGPAYLPAADGVTPLPGTPYTVIALPDTQFYAAFYPDIFDAQTRWIAGERVLGNVAFVVHEGDLVDSDDGAQWSVATRSMQLLDGLVPYVISTGNHDYGPGGDGWTTSRSTLIDSYFPVWKFAALPWFKGTFDPAHIENSYSLMDLPGGGGQWLVVSLEFGPRDEVLTWADGIVKQYPTTPVMIVTHAYLFQDNTRYDHVAHPVSGNDVQRASPYIYPFAMTPGAVNDGEEIWQKLVLGNSNIQFVLCGHVLDKGTGRLVSTRPDGTTVNQILANYQMDDYGGSGYLRILQFFPATRTVHIRTYSPYFDAYKTDPDNDFELRY
jgi:hypothetical protein